MEIWKVNRFCGKDTNDLLTLFFVSFFIGHHLSALWKKHGWFLFPELLLSMVNFFVFKILIYFCSCFGYIDAKEMGNRDAIKVCVNVEIKFWFMQKKSYYLIILVLRWKILYLFLDNGLLLSRNQVFCLKKSKFEKAPIQVKFIIFLWKFAHVFS